MADRDQFDSITGKQQGFILVIVLICLGLMSNTVLLLWRDSCLHMKMVTDFQSYLQTQWAHYHVVEILRHQLDRGVCQSKGSMDGFQFSCQYRGYSEGLGYYRLDTMKRTHDACLAWQSDVVRFRQGLVYKNLLIAQRQVKCPNLNSYPHHP